MRAKCAYYWQKMRLTYLSHFITRQRYFMARGGYLYLQVYICRYLYLHRYFQIVATIYKLFRVRLLILHGKDIIFLSRRLYNLSFER